MLVDYAHTPTRSRTCSSAARELTERALARGVRLPAATETAGKRPLMGEIAARLADRVIVTSDNPRSEDPEAIIAEILAGIARPVEHDADRRAAIRDRDRPARATAMSL